MSQETKVSNKEILKNCAKCFSVTEDELEYSLCCQAIAGKCEIVQKKHSLDTAKFTRDTLAKVILKILI